MSFAISLRGQDKNIPSPQDCKRLVVKILPAFSMSAHPHPLNLIREPLKRWHDDFVENSLFQRPRFGHVLVASGSDFTEKTIAVASIHLGMPNKERATCVAKHGYHLLSRLDLQ